MRSTRLALPPWKAEAIQNMTMVLNSAPDVERRSPVTLATHRQRTIRFSFSSLRCDDILLSKFPLYADSERGRYPVWESLDLDGFAPGSGSHVCHCHGSDRSYRFRPNPAKCVRRATIRNVSRLLDSGVTKVGKQGKIRIG